MIPIGIGMSPTTNGSRVESNELSVSGLGIKEVSQRAMLNQGGAISLDQEVCLEIILCLKTQDLEAITKSKVRFQILRD